MDTLADIIKVGNAAATAGEPIVPNWPQARGALYMFGRIAGGLDRVRLDQFEERFPPYGALDAHDQALVPNSQAYENYRTQTLRMLALLGAINDPWERLRMMIRRAGRDDIERCLPGLATPAKAAGLTPAEIRTDWVWALDAERGVLTDEQIERRARREGQQTPKANPARSVRQRLRRGVAVFNELFRLPQIAESGLLPPEPIGPPPVYDRQGNDICDLPPTLAGYQAAALNVPGGGLPQVWQAICTAGDFDMPVDPKADDLLDRVTWQRITQLQKPVTGVSDDSWRAYIGRTRRILLPHATLPVPERLPDWLEAIIETRRDRASLQALWRLMWERDMVDATPDELLRLETWREMWIEATPKIATRTWSVYEGRARKLMMQQATHQADPYRLVTRAWADLPAVSKTLLKPLRKPAEQALMRPLDLTPEWVADQELKQGLSPRRSAEVTEALREVFFLAAQVRRPVPLPDPAEEAWKALRAAVTAQGLSTRGLGAAESRALGDGLSPGELTPGWAAATAEKIPHHRRPEFASAVRLLDQWREHPALAAQLHAEDLGPLPDFRKGTKIEPPAAMMRELDDLLRAYKRAASTCRQGNSVLRKTWAAAVAAGLEVSTLGDLLAAEPVLADLDRTTRTRAAHLLKDLRGLESTAAA